MQDCMTVHFHFTSNAGVCSCKQHVIGVQAVLTAGLQDDCTKHNEQSVTFKCLIVPRCPLFFSDKIVKIYVSCKNKNHGILLFLFVLGLSATSLVGGLSNYNRKNGLHILSFCGVGPKLKAAGQKILCELDQIRHILAAVCP